MHGQTEATQGVASRRRGCPGDHRTAGRPRRVSAGHAGDVGCVDCRDGSGRRADAAAVSGYMVRNCQRCTIRVAIGPMPQTVLNTLEPLGYDTPIYCLVCALPAAKEPKTDVTVVPLGNTFEPKPAGD